MLTMLRNLILCISVNSFTFDYQPIYKMTTLFITKSGTYFAISLGNMKLEKMNSANKWDVQKNVLDSNIKPGSAFSKTPNKK